MMINPMMQIPGLEPTGTMPGSLSTEGLPKGLFAALFGEQQAALLAQTTGAPVLLWPDGTLSAAKEGEVIPPGALLILPDGTLLTAFGLPAAVHGEPTAPEAEPVTEPGQADDAHAVIAAFAPVPVPGEARSDAAVAGSKPASATLPGGGAQPVEVRSATVQPPASRAESAVAGTAVQAAPVQKPQEGGVVAQTVASTPQAEPYTGARQGGAGAFAASIFAAQSARIEANLARDAVRVLAAPVHDGESGAQALARTDTVRAVGETVPLMGQGPSNAGVSGLEARHEATALRVGISAERPNLGTLGDYTVRAVRVLSGDGEQSISVRLVPESLGELKLTVRTVGDTIHLHVASSSLAVRDVFDGQMQGLRDALQREGIDLTRVTIGPDTPGHNASPRHTGGEAANQQGAAGSAAHRGLAHGEDTQSHDGLRPSYRYAPSPPDVTLDLFA